MHMQIYEIWFPNGFQTAVLIIGNITIEFPVVDYLFDFICAFLIVDYV